MKCITVVVLALVIWRCCKSTEDLIAVNRINGSVSGAYRSIVKASLPTSISFNTWAFAEGKADETLHFFTLPEFTDATVVLPHRILKPNSALWYQAELSIPESGVILVSADDGAQVFINNEKAERVDADIFVVAKTGLCKITIRVLNNAMSGGLNKVEFASSAVFRKFQDEQQHNYRREWIIRKSEQHPIDTSIKSELENGQPGHATDRLEQIEKRLAAYPLLIGPCILLSDSVGVTIMITTQQPEDITLHWGRNKLLDHKLIKKGRTVFFRLDSLQRDTEYDYQIAAGKTKSEVFSFKSWSEADTFSFNVWGDSQSGWDQFAAHMQNANKHNDAFGIGVGDLVGNGSDVREWREFFSLLSMSASGKPYYLVAGNHDYDGFYDDLHPRFYDEFTPYSPGEYFSWRYGNCAFIALNPNGSFPIGIDSLQLRWFHEQITSKWWQRADWRFVLVHQPPYSQGWAGYHGDSAISNVLDPVMESAKIDFVVAGHTHDYERMTKRFGAHRGNYLIVGGGGGSLEPPESSADPVMDKIIKLHDMGRFYITRERVRFVCYGAEGQVLDSLSFTRPQ